MTVTFLFTDIEGSTRLWERAAEAMRAALARHNDFIQQAATDHRGYVFQVVGDGCCIAFDDAADALAAALAAQRALQRAAWDETGPLRVRMALHTGPAERSGTGYASSPTLNRVARLMAAAHGGQVVLSQTAVAALAGRLPPGATLRDLGLRRLRDLSAPEQVYQLVVTDLRADFPPLRTLDTRPTNLPAQPTPLIGRVRETAAVTSLLRAPGRTGAGVRLLTLTGPGGTGKTRLALQVAAELLDEYRDGVFFVPLALLRDPALVAPAIAQALEVVESGGRPLVRCLEDFLRDRQLLLCLDNFEHVLPAAALVAELLAAAPGLAALATSREALHVYGEHEFPVPPLAWPDLAQLPPADVAMQYSAVALFVARAQAVRPGFALEPGAVAAIAEICARLDGLPLAIELAAAHCKWLAPQAVLARLRASPLALLTGGPRDLPARQRTLREAIAWSYDLLDATEKALFARLALLAGGGTLEAVSALAATAPGLPGECPDTMIALAEKSLLRQGEGPDGEPRFGMLETVREYALERLAESGVETALRQGHAEHYLGLAVRAEPELTGPAQAAWLKRLEVEHGNLRAALDWLLARDAAAAARLAAALWRFWFGHGHLGEGRRALSAVLAAGTAPAGPLHARLLNGAGALAYAQGDYEQATLLYGESLALYRAHGDKVGATHALNRLGGVAFSQGDYAQAARLWEENLRLFRELHDARGIAYTLNNLGTLAVSRGDYAGARTFHEESLALKRGMHDRHGIALSLNNLGVVWLHLGDNAQAAALQEQSLSLFRELGDTRGEAAALSNLARAALHKGDAGAARALYRESLGLFQQLGDREGLAECLEGLAAGTQAGPADRRHAAMLYAAAEALRRAIGAPLSPADQPVHARRVDALRTALGAEAFAAAWGEGEATPVDAVLELALRAA